MEKLWFLPIILFVAVTYKVFVNWQFRKRLTTLRKTYEAYVRELSKGDTGKPGWNITRHQTEIVELFKRAGVKNNTVLRTEPIGFGQIHNQTLSIFDNIALADREVVGNVTNDFHFADGVYLKRIKEAFSPIY